MFNGKAWNQTCDPWFTRHRFIPYTMVGPKNFMWLFHGSSQYWARRIYGSCLYFMTGAPEGSPKMALWRSQESNIYHGARKKTFCGFPRNKPVLPGWFNMCVLALRREHPKAQRKRFYGEARNRTWDPWFTRHMFIPYTTVLLKTFCGFPW